MSLTGASGANIRPVRIDFQATDGVSPVLQRQAEQVQRTEQTGKAAFEAIGKASDRAAQDMKRAMDAASRSVQQLEERLQQAKVKESLRQMEEESRRLRDEFHRNIGMALRDLQQTFDGLSRGIQSFAASSQGITSVRQAFETMSREAGTSSEALLSRLKAVSRGTIDETNLMRQANTAMMTAGSQIAESLPRIYEIARAASRAFGRDFEDSSNRIILGIAKLEPEVLDEIGITAKLTDVFEAYGATLGKTGDQLTRTEQQHAFLNEVLRQGGDIIRKAGPDTETFADSYKQMQAVVTDLKDAVVSAADKVPVLGTALAGLALTAEGLSSVSGTLMGINAAVQLAGPAAATWGAAIAGAAVLALPDVLALKQAIEGANRDMQAAAETMIGPYLSKFKEGIDRFSEMGRKMEAAKAELQAIQQASDKFNESGKRLSSEWKEGTRLLGENIAMLREFGATEAEINRAVEQFGKDYKGYIRDRKDLYAVAAKAEADALQEREEADRKSLQQSAKEHRAHEQQELKARRAFEREMKKIEKERQDAFKADFRDASEGRKLAMQDELEDLKAQKETLGGILEEWIAHEQAVKDSGVAILDWSKSSKKAIEDYKAAVGAVLASGEAGGGLKPFKLRDFNLFEFGAKARAKDMVREQLGPPPEANGNVSAFIRVANPFGVVNGLNNPLDAAIGQYESLQSKITLLESQLQTHTPTVEKYRQAFYGTGITLGEVSTLIAETHRRLYEQADALENTLPTLADATDQFRYAGQSVQDVGRAMGRMGLAADSIKGNLAGAGEEVGRFSDKIGEQGNIQGNLNTLGQAFSGFSGSAATFRGYFDNPATGINPAVEKLRDLLLDRGSGAGAQATLKSSIKDFSSFLADTFQDLTAQNPMDQAFKSFRDYWTDINTALNGTSGLVQNLGAVGPALTTLAGNVNTFATTSSGTLAATQLTGVATGLSGLNTQIGILKDQGSNFSTVTAAFSNWADDVGTIKEKIDALGQTGDAGPIGKLKAALNAFTTSSVSTFTGTVSSVKGSLETLYKSDDSGALKDIVTGAGKAGKALADTGDTTSLISRFKTLLDDAATAGDPDGPLTKVEAAFGSWATAFGTLGGDKSKAGSVAAVAAAVLTLKDNLNTLVQSRASNNADLWFKQSPSANPWDSIGTIMDSRRGLTSENKLITNWGADQDPSAAVDSLVSYWSAAGLAGRRTGGGASAVAVEGGGVHIHGGIHVHMNGSPADAQAGRKIANEVSRELGSRLKNLIPRKAGGRI